MTNIQSFLPPWIITRAFIHMVLRKWPQRRCSYRTDFFVLIKLFHIPYHGPKSIGLLNKLQAWANITTEIGDINWYKPSLHLRSRLETLTWSEGNSTQWMALGSGKFHEPETIPVEDLINIVLCNDMKKGPSSLQHFNLLWDKNNWYNVLACYQL